MKTLFSPTPITDSRGFDPAWKLFGRVDQVVVKATPQWSQDVHIGFILKLIIRVTVAMYNCLPK